MAKFSISTKGNIVKVTQKQLGKFNINERELTIFEKNLLPGFFRPQVITKHRIEYVAPLGISLKSYMKDNFTVHKLYSVMAQIVEMTKRAERYGFYLHNIVLDTQLIYVKKTTGELFFLYEPLMERKNSINVFAFLGDVIEGLQYSDKQLGEEIQKLEAFLSNPENYRIEDIENFITTHYPQIYQQVIRVENGKSGYISSNKLSYQKQQKPPVAQSEQCYEDEEEMGTTLLAEEEGTTLLEEEGTTLLQSEPTATLVRRRTGDVIVVSGTEFHIGKSVSADYTIADNNTISRTHAVISRKPEGYVISDENSKNHTYVNGVILTPGQQQVLCNGDVIRMSDEEFDFSV